MNQLFQILPDEAGLIGAGDSAKPTTSPEAHLRQDQSLQLGNVSFFLDFMSLAQFKDFFFSQLTQTIQFSHAFKDFAQYCSVLERDYPILHEAFKVLTKALYQVIAL